MQRSIVAAAALVALAPVAALTTAGGPASAGLATSVASRATTYSVVARINQSEVVSGEDVVRIAGSVKPRAVGQVVVLQQRLDGKKGWKKSSQGVIKQNGSFVLRDRPSAPGIRFYRVVKAASGGVKAGTSRQLRLEVWSWQRLVDRAHGAYNGVGFWETPQFGTETYPDSIVDYTPGSPAYVEFTLGGKCRSLRASYALTDTSASGANGTVRLTVDGVGVLGVNLATGTIVRDHVTDVTGAFRIRFDFTSSYIPAGYAAIGTPEVLCLD